ncbi:hypothetical protein PLESTB_000451100 [Pleodorina starrii]|uniref:Uncharacterized protein n=1 Tax=Pleodorina starrii TaxID=330485 RepID=A0A9W6BFQ6_9CHLO|nr:hypothetical protein PLESTM_000752500 [Pleodorina starrii]GLC50960.1 hypothetical protein PLESTB_000451100 [Pleodorina starrii]
MGGSEVRARCSHVHVCISSTGLPSSPTIVSPIALSPHVTSPHSFPLEGQPNRHLGLVVVSTWKRLLVAVIPLFLLLLILSAVFVANSGRPTQLSGPSKVPCSSRGALPAITDIYVIHSYWSEERRHIAPALCDWFQKNGGQLADVPCTLFPGFWASAATRDQILDLVARRIVAPETHAKPQGPLTQLLYRLGFSEASPLFDEKEEVTNLSYLGTAASHLLAVQNWTMEMVKQGVPPTERANRHLLLFEDDAVVTPESLTALQDVLGRLDPCYDVVGLDSRDSFCMLSTISSSLLSALRLRKSPSVRLVPARMSYSRNTGLVVSYKGAMKLLSGLPVTREIDLWFRDLMTDQVLKIFVACPRIVGAIGLETVKRR